MEKLTTEILTGDGICISRGTQKDGVYCPSTYIMAVIHVGGGTVAVSGARFTVTSDSVLLLAPGDICTTAFSADTDAYFYRFVPEALYGNTTQLLTPFAGLRYRTRGEMKEAAFAHICRMREFGETVQENALPLARMLLSEALLYLAPDKCMTPDTAVTRAAAYLAEHSEQQISLDALAGSVGMSKYHLCRIFRRESGLPPHAYLNCLRIWHAAALIRQGMPATEVGRAVGFGDYSTFYRTYKKLTGTPPSGIVPEEVNPA